MTSAPARAVAENSPGIDRAYVRQVVRVRSYRTVSTVIIVAGAAAAFAFVSTLDDVNTIFSTAASVFGVALAAALAIEARGGVRNVIRTDLLMLLALYALTFLEFLFPQASFGRRSHRGRSDHRHGRSAGRLRGPGRRPTLRPAHAAECQAWIGGAVRPAADDG